MDNRHRDKGKRPATSSPTRRTAAPTRKKTQKREHSAGGVAPRKPVKRRTESQPKQRPAAKPSRRVKSDKKKRRTHAGTIVFTVIFLTVITYMCRAVFALLNKTEVPGITVSYGSVDLPEITDAIIIREERVYKSPKPGVISFQYANYDRVKKGSLVCSVADQQAVAQLTEDITDYNSRIMQMQSMRMNISGFAGDVENRNKYIKTSVEKGIPEFINGKMGKLQEFADNITQNIDMRNQMLLTDEKGSVKELITAKNDAATRLQSNMTNISTEDSGILCYVVDGMEEILNFENKDNLTEEHIRMTVDYSMLEKNHEVAENDPIFKIVESNEWYLAALVPPEALLTFKEGSFKTIYVKKEADFVPMEVQVHKTSERDNKGFILFKATHSMIDYLDCRNVKLKLSDTSQQGFKVPVTAITDKTFLKIPNSYVKTEGQATVLKKVNENIETIPIKTLDSVPADEAYTYVLLDFNTLKLGDLLLKDEDDTEPYEITEVENVRGVFKINYGYAEFCKVVVDAEATTINGFCILDSGENKRLKISDQIIVDAKNIVEGQPVF